MENMNDARELDQLKRQVLENLSALKGAPSLQIHDVPPDWNSRAVAPEPDPEASGAAAAEAEDGVIKREHPAEFTPAEGASPMDTTR